MDSDLIGTDIEAHASAIKTAYEKLASGGEGALNASGHRFPVGATKVLHFLNPELFMIIDANAAKALRQHCGIPYVNTTQPGYSGALYIRSLEATKELIIQYGVDRFRQLECETPLTRIFDKIVFAHGALM